MRQGFDRVTAQIEKLMEVLRLESRTEVLLRKILPAKLGVPTIEKLIVVALKAGRETAGAAYAELFSESEIQQLIDMQSSPLGQKLLNTEPLVGARMETAVTAACNSALGLKD